VAHFMPDLVDGDTVFSAGKATIIFFCDTLQVEINEWHNFYGSSDIRAWYHGQSLGVIDVMGRNNCHMDQPNFKNIDALRDTLALLQTSEKQIGNHPGVLIFDEPTQHSIGAEDANAFFKSIIALGNKCQVIVGITVNNADIKNVISNLEPERYKYIHIGEKAFV